MVSCAAVLYQGKSSSFFCKSSDNLFVVKTISSTETVSMLDFVPAYLKHVQYVQHRFVCTVAYVELPP